MEENDREVYKSFHRVLILSILYDLKKQGKDGMNVTQLAQKLMIARVSVYHHLQFLEKRGLVEKHKPKKKVGNPSIWSVTKKAKPIPKSLLSAANRIFKMDERIDHL